MRKHIVISTIVLAVLVTIGAFFVHHRANPLSVAQPSQSPVKPSKRSARTEVATSNRPARPQTALVFTGTHQKDVRLQIIRTILDLQADSLTRQKAVRTLPRDLLPERCKLLMDFLSTRHAEDETQVGHVLKNDIMDVLIGQKTPDTGLTTLFAGIYQDKAQSPVIRDYAVQHLALLSERLDGPMNWDPSWVQTQQKQIQDTLWQCAEAHDSSISGTALLGLAQISETHAELDRSRLSQTAVAMTYTGIDEAARVTAFQICARLQVSSSLPVMINAAQSDSSSIVRISAIGALGLIGNLDQLPILSQIADQNARFRPVAILAMNKIQNRTR